MVKQNWYSAIKKISSPLGTDPFGPSSLSDLTRESPFGNVGGDSHTGILEPSQGLHHPNDYFAEGEHTPATEKRLRDKKRKKNRKVKIIKNKQKEKCLVYAQWGTGGPKIPTWTEDHWLMDTYEKIKSKNKQPDQGSKQKTKQTQESQIPQQQNKEDINSSTSVIDKSLLSTISIQSASGQEMEIGSGFIIGNKTILTCAHVVLQKTEKNPNQYNITINHGGKKAKASLWAYDINLDVAVLIVNDENFDLSNSLSLGDSSNIKQGDDIFIVGTPLGFENILGKGIISSKPTWYEEEGSKKEYIFISTNVSPGNSGGPVVKVEDASVVGIVAAIIAEEGGGDIAGLNAAIPINTVKTFLSNNGINFQEA